MTDTNAAALIDALKEQANQILSQALGTRELVGFDITSAGNFFYSWQDSANVQLFNDPTFQWINGNLNGAATPLTFDGTFTNVFLQAISSISYSLSSADQAALTKASLAASQQAAALQNQWLTSFRAFPAGDGTPIDAIATEIATKWASPPTDLPTMQNALDLTQLLNKAPASGQQIIPLVTNWLNALSSAVSLQNSVSLNNAYLRRAKAAIQSPTLANGGMTLNDTAMSIVPAYSVTTPVSTIENSLNGGSPVVTLQTSVQKTSSDKATVNIKGGASFDIPIASFLSIGVGGGTNYFSDKLVSSDSETTVEMTFPGVNLVTFGPALFRQSGSSLDWFWMQPVADAIRNTGKDVSGYKFSPMPSIDFSEGGGFGYLGGVVVSAYPTIKITTKTSNYASVEQSFEQNSSLSVSFLGIQLGSASEATSNVSTSVDASQSTVTIEISPPAQAVAGTLNNAQAWVLGVLPVYPGADAAKAAAA